MPTRPQLLTDLAAAVRAGERPPPHRDVNVLGVERGTKQGLQAEANAVRRADGEAA